MVLHLWRIIFCFVLCIGSLRGLEFWIGETGHCNDSACIEEDAASSFIQVRKTRKRSHSSLADLISAHGTLGAVDETTPQKDGPTTRKEDSSQKAASLREDAKLTAVKTFDCNKNGKAMSMVKKAKGFSVCEIDRESGNFTEVLTLSFADLPQLTDVSACGINPLDKIMYCTVFAWNGFIAKMGMQELDVEAGIFNSMTNTLNMGPPYAKTPDAAFNACNVNPVGNAAFCSMFDWKSYVIRIDSTRIEYVAKLPPVKFVAGTFSPKKGTYFTATKDARFARIRGLHLVKGYAEMTDNNVLDLTGETLFKPKPFKATGDIVAILGDLDRDGDLENYVMAMHGKSVYIAQYEEKKGNFTRSWVLPVTGKKWSAYNSAWTFQGKVFFGASDKSGIWEVPLEGVDLSDSKTKLKSTALQLRKASPLEDEGDGLNCVTSPDPWLTNSQKFDCKKNPGPIQIARDSDQKLYNVSTIDLTSGAYSLLYTVPFTRTNPPFFSLNAVGISPIDSVAYGCLQLFALPANFYLVRFDSEKVEFVALLKGPSPPIAGTFDVVGNYFYMANPVLKRVESPHLLKGYDIPYDERLADLTDIPSVSMAGAGYFSDIVAVIADLANSGSKAEYVLALNNLRQFAVIEYRNDTNRKWLLPTVDVLNDTKNNFGAAWNYDGRVFWAANSGAGIFEVNMTSLDLNKPTALVNVSYAGKANAIDENDGANCLIGSPFTVAASPLPESRLD
mmetsp:Transcript_17455/g.32967  ORF Transcript_17455/g.32967 Transcript_17455/m.32967 type:complete len:730 (-) Transcript_17455:132-2321(-)